MSEEASIAGPAFDPLPILEPEGAGGSGSSTAKIALAMLTQGDPAFLQPTKAQRRNLAMAFAAEDKIVYGRAFDAVRVPDGLDIDLDDPSSRTSHSWCCTRSSRPIAPISELTSKAISSP